MFNKVVLVGNLTRDIELRYTTSGSAIGNSGIAVTRKFNTNGENVKRHALLTYRSLANQLR